MHNATKDKVEYARKILDLLYSGKHIPDKEIKEILSWLADEENEPYLEIPMEKIFSDLEVRYKGAAPTPGGWGKFLAANDLQQEWASYKAEKAAGDEPVFKNKKVISLRRRFAWRVAAVLVPLLIAAGAVTLTVVKTGLDAREGKPAAFETAMTTQPAPAGWVRVSAGTGEREMELPDGTRIKLDHGSTLEYGNDFLKKRIVILTGDAFFSVSKIDGKPFEVLYNEMTVRVLGTEFYLKEKDNSSEVTLFSGAVEIDAAHQTIRLAPNQQLVIDRTIEDFSVLELTEAQIARIQRGKLRFQGTPLHEALKQTGEFYGVEMDVGRFWNDEQVRLDIDLNDELEDVLFLLQSLSGNAFRYKIKEDRVIIYGL